MPPAELDLSSQAFAELDRPVSYERDVKPVLESRCVVCHACYDAPCQLLLSSYEGAQRGATKQPVYDSSRLEAMPPTRMFVDAHSTEEWRARDFFSVLGPRPARGAAPAADPLLLYMLALGRAHPFAEGQRLPAEVGLDIDRTLSCPAPGEFDGYAREHPLGGMPYGMAPLRDEELRILASLGRAGRAAARRPRRFPRARRAQVAQVGDLPERRLAQAAHHRPLSLRALVPGPPALRGASRAGPFFEVVRSRTAPGEADRRDRHGAPVRRSGRRARLVSPAADRTRRSCTRRTSCIRSATRSCERLRELFLDSDWTADADCRATRRRRPRTRSSPSTRFRRAAATQYLLDDAQYFIMTFIRGPVCRGQVAVDVIEDQFWVAFLDPSRDLSVTDPGFPREDRAAAQPARRARQRLRARRAVARVRPQAAQVPGDARELLRRASIPQHRGPALDWIWDGDRKNPNALLTVFRNFDNATVVKGFVGEIPKTAWVMDYPIFERIYYDLVAGFNIFGNVVAPGGDASLHGPPAHAVGESLPHLPARGPARGDPRLLVRGRHPQAVLRGRGPPAGARSRHADPIQDVGLEGRAAGDDDRAGRPGGRSAGSAQSLRAAPVRPAGRERGRARASSASSSGSPSVKGEFVPLLPEVAFLRVRVAGARRASTISSTRSSTTTRTPTSPSCSARTSAGFPRTTRSASCAGTSGATRTSSSRWRPAKLPEFVGGLLALRSDADLERFVGEPRHPPHERALLGDDRLAARGSEAPRAHRGGALRLRPLRESLAQSPRCAGGNFSSRRAMAPRRRVSALLAAQADEDLGAHVAHPDAPLGRRVGEPQREGAERRRVVGAVPGVHGEIVREPVVGGSRRSPGDSRGPRTPRSRPPGSASPYPSG